MSLRDALRAFLDHRLVVLQRRSRFRLDKIERRLEILAGYLIAYLNLDAVIKIIREEDEPKPKLMKRFKLTDTQAEAILNMRLRSLRRLEEIEIKGEHKALEAERKDLKALLKSEDKQWKVVGEEIKAIQKKFSRSTPLGKRRTGFGDAPSADIVPLEAMIEREPVTIICSEKGWIRAAKGHLAPDTDLKYKEGDRGRFVFHAETTDKLLLFATDGRFFTLGCDKLPGGRGHGEPVRLMVDLGNDKDIVALFVYRPETRLLVAASDGRGFIVEADNVLASTKNGKQVLNVSGSIEAQVCTPVAGDTVAVVGENRKLLVFPLDELPEMTRGRGVVLQKYKDGGLSDAKVFSLAEGLTWRIGERIRTETDLVAWQGKRAAAGRLAPKGFSSANKF